MSDYSEQLQGSVLQALEQKEPISIQGGASKIFYGREITGKPLLTTKHRGIINYEPKELVVTARCGTSMQELESELSSQGQMLAFEPPHFAKSATLGGTIACGLSGPRRPYSGSARDFVLGTRIINGQGDVLQFGGEVMKNVAGYDVSRLMVGALGTLGLLLDISLKVMPLPEYETTLIIECKVEEATQLMNKWTGSSMPVSAACYDGEKLYLRLSGTHAAVISASNQMGGEVLQNEAGFWNNITELKHVFFSAASSEKNKILWRLSLPVDAPSITLPGKQLIDWGGAQRWFISDIDPVDVRQAIESLGGHATIFRNGDRQSDIFHPLADSLAVLHRQLKLSFDPKRIFNPGRLYRGL